MRKNKKILLINPSGWQKESINIGLAYLASPLVRDGFDVLILDINRYALDDSALQERAQQYDPFLIGISVKTATANEGGRVANLLAEIITDAVFIAGGPHVTLCAPRYFHDYPVFSFGIMGEGEVSFPTLAKVVYEEHSVAELQGVVWRRGDDVIVNDWAPPNNLNDILPPNLDIIEGFSWDGFRYPILSSRGCPFQCIYCCVNKLTGSNKWRCRSDKNVADELSFLVQNKGLTAFELWDDNFTLDIQRAKDFCSELIKRKLNLSWWCHNGIRADRIDDELAQLMKKAGCTSIAFGMETGSPETFAAIQKGEPLSAVVNAVKTVKKAGIQAVGYFIIGLPGDTLESFVETVRFQRSLKLDHYVYGMLIPYPQTKVWDIVHDRGILLREITETQHFSNDVVPVSFELPEFPSRDMVRAFYIAKYMDLYEALDRNKNPAHIIYYKADLYQDHIAGMIIASHPGTSHTLITSTPLEQIYKQKGFSQVPKDVAFTTAIDLPMQLVRQGAVFVCTGSTVPRSLLFANANIVLLNPLRPLHLTVQVRRYLSRSLLPDFLTAMLGTAAAASDVLGYFGLKKVWLVVKIQFLYPHLNTLRLQQEHIRAKRQKIASIAKKHLPSSSFLSRLQQNLQAFGKHIVIPAHDFLAQTTGKTRSMLISLSRWWVSVSTPAIFIWTKFRLKQLKHSEKEFPFDDHPTHM